MPPALARRITQRLWTADPNLKSCFEHIVSGPRAIAKTSKNSEISWARFEAAVQDRGGGRTAQCFRVACARVASTQHER
eukprot:14095847-Alexandrium_andersonii.AAC.1